MHRNGKQHCSRNDDGMLFERLYSNMRIQLLLLHFTFAIFFHRWHLRILYLKYTTSLFSERHDDAYISLPYVREFNEISFQNVTMLPNGELHVNGRRMYWHDDTDNTYRFANRKRPGSYIIVQEAIRKSRAPTCPHVCDSGSNQRKYVQCPAGRRRGSHCKGNRAYSECH